MKAADYTAPKSISVGVVIFCCLKVVLGCTGMWRHLGERQGCGGTQSRPVVGDSLIHGEAHLIGRGQPVHCGQPDPYQTRRLHVQAGQRQDRKFLQSVTWEQI